MSKQVLEEIEEILERLIEMPDSPKRELVLELLLEKIRRAIVA